MQLQSMQISSTALPYFLHQNHSMLVHTIRPCIKCMYANKTQFRWLVKQIFQMQINQLTQFLFNFV